MKINNLMIISSLMITSLTFAAESQQDKERRIRQEQAEQARRDTENRTWMAHAQMTGQQISTSQQFQMSAMDRASAWLQNQNTKK